MGSVVDFSGVNEPENKVTTGFKIVTKGAKELTITNVEDGESQSGKPFMNITFFSKMDDADFKHKFYLTKGALPRVQSLMIGFTGKKLSGEVDTTAIAAQLVGKTSNCIVDAKIVEKESNGKIYKNEYPELRFADFASLTVPFKDEDARVKDESAPAAVREAATGVLDTIGSDTDDSDLPW